MLSVKYLFSLRKIHLMLLRKYLGPLVVTFFIAEFVLLMQFLWKYIDELVGKGLDLFTLSQLLFYASVTFIPLALPISVLLSSLMTFGSIGEHYELAAAKSVGISLWQLMKPIFFVSIILAFSAFYFSNNILPLANLKMTRLLYDISNTKPALNIKEGIFYRDIENMVIKISKKEKDGKTIHNIIIYDHSKYTGNTNIIISRSGQMDVTPDKQYLILKLFNGFIYKEKLEKREDYINRPLERIKFRMLTKKIDLSSFAMQRTNEEFFKEHYQMMDILQLKLMSDSLAIEAANLKTKFASQVIGYWHFFHNMDSLINIKDNNSTLEDTMFLDNFNVTTQKFIVENAIRSAQNIAQILEYQQMELKSVLKYYRRYLVEMHRKFTLSIACVLLFFIGAPLGAIIRKGGLGMPLVVATLIFIMYYVISIIGEKFVREGAWNIFFGMWISSIILAPISVWITYKTFQDSPVMDSEAWNRFLERVLFLFKKAFHELSSYIK